MRFAPGAALVAIAALAAGGCGGGGDKSAEPGEVVVAPTQKTEAMILFRARTGNPPAYDLVLLDADTGKARVLTGDSRPGTTRPILFDRAQWSPDGRRLAFTGDLPENEAVPFGRTDVFVIDADGSNRRQLTHSGTSFAPIWSPDGRTIVFARRPYPQAQSPKRVLTAALWAVGPDGEDERRLLPDVEGVTDIPGSWKPDGSAFAFTRSTYAPPGPFGESVSTSTVYVADADGSDVHKLLDNASGPAWSPDGRLLALASDRDRNGSLTYGDRSIAANELYVTRSDGSRLRRLTRSRDVNELAPSWSPDGARLAFQRGRVVDNAEGTSLWAMNVDGTCPARIAADPKLDVWYARPAWRPGRPIGGARLLRCKPKGA